MDTAIKLDDIERTKCEVWTRIMGYYRPKEYANAGKQQEFVDRKYFVEAGRLFDDQQSDPTY